MNALYVALGLVALAGLVFVVWVIVAANELIRVDRHEQ